MPNARVLPDWHLRLGYGVDYPHHYYAGAIGLFDRLELHGQFTRVETLTAFPGEGYGDYKDRAAGFRLILLPESDRWPQLALGAFDATGTALFGSRYLVASKMFGPLDVTVGLGQGTLAGEYVRDTLRAGTSNNSLAFLTSGLSRRTKLFGGVEYRVSPDLTLALEYSSQDRANMFGYRDNSGRQLLADKSNFPLHAGLKYRLHDKVHARVATMGGSTLAGGVVVQLPLRPQGFLAWRQPDVRLAGERRRWQAHAAADEELAHLVGHAVKAEGFRGVAVSVGDQAIWVEAVNTIHLSDSRALGRLALVVERLAPARITVFYLNLKDHRTVMLSLRTARDELRAYLAGELTGESFLAAGHLELHDRRNRRSFLAAAPSRRPVVVPDKRFSWEINPRLRTFWNNRRGFFKHKGLLEARADYRLWPGASLAGELELTLFNEWGELKYEPLERDPIRTDLALYEEKSRPRLSLLALEQYHDFPGPVRGRFAAGIFESAYVGLGGELFRYFDDGRWGVGLESQVVRKRHLEKNFSLHPDQTSWYSTAFVNLYANLWPARGVEAGLKIGRFLAGDPGVRFELRRSFDYITVGAWYTVTDTSRFAAPENRADRQQGVYIRFPLALFKDADVRGHLRYLMTSFTRDTGHTVRQPGSLYPMDPWSTSDHVRRTLEDMKIHRH